jgi:CRISPR-associated protein Cas2
MFVLMVYDVGEKRVAKVLRLARTSLSWVQNSVLEGELSPGAFAEFKMKVRKILDEEYDRVLFYVWRSGKYTSRESLGRESGGEDFFVI